MNELSSDGGPAFPVDVNYKITTPLHKDSDLVKMELGHYPGMSLRDWFAGMSLMGIQSNPGNNEQHFARDAQLAYESADAMLTARKNERTNDDD